MLRNNIEDCYKIDFKDLFKCEEDFYAYLEETKDKVNEIKLYENKLFKNQDNFGKVLYLMQSINIRIEKLYTYANLNCDFDLSDSHNNELLGKVLTLYDLSNNNTSYIIPEIIKNDYSFIENRIKNDANLKAFEGFLKDIFREKKHYLTKKEESLLTKLNCTFRTPDEIMTKLRDVDLTFSNILDKDGKIHEMNEVNYFKYKESDDRVLRKNAFDSMYKAYKSINSSASALYASSVHNSNVIASIRKYKSALDNSLYTNQVDCRIYDILLNSVNKNLVLLHKQFDLRGKMLGLEEVHLYDISASILKEEKNIYNYEKAQSLVIESVKPLGKEYVSIIKKAFAERWVDVYSSDNKANGAYCTCVYDAHPYVLMNFNNDFESVSTLTHELGHAMHYYYAATNNSYTNYNYSIFVAEVASQVNELLLLKYMKKMAKDENDILYYYNSILNDFKNIIGRQTMFAEFEKLVHEYDEKEEIITSDYLNEEYLKLNKKYFGDNVVVDEQIKYEWSRIPHFYSDFYVYQYSTGYVAALIIAESIFSSDQEAIDKYLKFLKIGSKLNPVESLKVAGVNMLDEAIYDKAFNIYKEAIEVLEKKYDSKDNEINE